MTSLVSFGDVAFPQKVIEVSCHPPIHYALTGHLPSLRVKRLGHSWLVSIFTCPRRYGTVSGPMVRDATLVPTLFQERGRLLPRTLT